MRSYLGEEHGVFGPVGDLFGFDDVPSIGQGSDPLAEINGPLVRLANETLSKFLGLTALIPSLPSKAQQDAADDIVKAKWYNVSFLGIGPGKYNLLELAPLIETYAKEPSSQFVRIGSDLKVSRSREDRLNSFVKGVGKLVDYMKQYFVLPTKLITTDTTAESLLATAIAATAKASASRNPVDVATARALAESAKAQANIKGNSSVTTKADALLAQIDAIAVLTVAPSAGKTTDGGTGTGMDTNTLLLIGGGAVVLIGAILIINRK